MSATSSTQDKGSVVFNAQKINHSYWDIYLDSRPTYSSAFYDLIYDYHTKAGNNRWNLAEDIGTGPGNAAAVFSKRFDKVHASDPGDTHVEVAKQRLARDGIANVTVYKANGETISQTGITSPGTADLLTVAEAIPLMDAPKALNSFSEVLAPGGTLAIWFYGRPIFVDPVSQSCATTKAARCQRIFDEICIRAYSRIRPMKGTHWEQTTTRLFSWLDDLELPESTWGKVQRRKWNADRPLSFYDEAACDHAVVTKYQQRDDEERYDVADRSFWSKTWNIEGVKRFIGVLLPQFTEQFAQEIGTDQYYAELERAMGGPDGAMQITWPVVLILATRK
ncbi:S-adenosyl-L-methionine-dependent methyltransferase [Viridothelium virens]|uniref:S-adenosyl-L-methionine-dependent methyltransferase n=1 Tax=Viridothelium virens TaxID=1048519 RepID=A0A6A6HBK0_VIRVR|nr:S-adenosyl-L-methionine-dependent methyltransferase [Viridothelium virens]